MPNGIMVLDYERKGDEQTVIEDISREKAHRVMDRLNELNDENQELQFQCNLLQEEANEFHRGARENANRVRQLKIENKKLKQDLKDCKKLAGKRLNKIRNHRAVIEDLGGSIRAYKGQISQLNEKIEKIQEAMEDTGAVTKRQLEEILND